MTRELKILTLTLLAGFVLIAISSAYWSVFQHNDLLTRRDNPRRLFAEQNFARGMIVDRNGILLAASDPYPTTLYRQRIYPYEGVAGAVGYYSFLYGAEGLEAAFNDVLTGDYGQADAWQEWWDDLLNRPPLGFDLRSTIDLNVQQALTAAFGERNGAAIVLHVPSGQIWAMVSQPTFDPTLLDLNFEVFIDESNRTRSPLFNRALWQPYQPGSAIQPVLLAGLLLSGDSLDRLIPNADEPINFASPDTPWNDLTCLTSLPEAEELSLQAAFTYACPQPFVTALHEPTIYGAFDGWLQQFGFQEAPPLYRMQPASVPIPFPLAERPDPIPQAELEAIGQGQVVVTPLQMARFVAAIANHGSAPFLTMADAYRKSGDTDWRLFDIPADSAELMQPEVADQVRTTLRYTAQHSPLVQAASPDENTPLFGHVGIAYNRNTEEFTSWFLGFIELPDGTSVVVVITLENAEAPDDAAHVAQAAFSSLTQ